MKNYLNRILVLSAALSLSASAIIQPPLPAGGGSAQSSLIGEIFSMRGAGTNRNTFLTNFVDACYSPNTNQLFCTVAGTTAARGKYVLKGPAFTSGLIYTNVSGAAFACKDLGGNQTGDNLQSPFYVGSTTNNTTTAWYVSQIDFLTGWRNDQSNAGETWAGTLPAPTFVYGTNTTYVTNKVLAEVGFLTRNPNTIFVDQIKGSDTGGALGMCPFRTCLAARNYATNGQTIYVAPGTYSETGNLLKNGVNWNFADGSSVGYDGRIGDAEKYVFSDIGIGAVTSNIEGDVLHYVSKSYYKTEAILIVNSASNVKFKFKLADCTAWVPKGSSAFVGVATVSNCAFSSFDFGEINSKQASNTLAMVDSDDSAATYGQLVNRAGSDCGFYWLQGEMHVKFVKMICYRGQQGDRGFPYAFWPDVPSSVTSQTDMYINGNLLYGTLYLTGDSTSARVWVNIDGEQSQLLTQTAAVYPYHSYKFYLTEQKMSAKGAGFNYAGGGTGYSWISIQKLSCSGQWIFCNASGQHFVGNILELEDSITNGIADGIQWSGSDFNLTGNLCTSSNGPLVTISSQVTNYTISGYKFQTFGSKSPVLISHASSSNALFKNCVFVSRGTNAINATVAAKVGSLANLANITNHANITLLPSAGFTVDAAVK